MKSSGLLIAVLIAFFTFSCEEENENVCRSGAIVHEFNGFVSGRYLYDEEEDAFFIRYTVPGTIDSVYDGYLCYELVTNFDLVENLPIQFTGSFRELPENSHLAPQFGGQEVFYLDLDGIRPDQ